MTLIDDDLDSDIARMLTIRHNRRTLGFAYYETNPGASRQQYGKKQRVRPSLAGQPGWRHRWPPQNVKPAPPKPPPATTRPGTALRTADLLEHTLTFAHAGLDIIESRRK